MVFDVLLFKGQVLVSEFFLSKIHELGYSIISSWVEPLVKSCNIKIVFEVFIS